MARQTQTMDRVRERALELGVYLPLGAYARLRDEIVDLDLPNLNQKRIEKLFSDLINRGQERVQPVEQLVRRRTRRITRQANKQVTETTQRVQKTAKKTTKRATAASAAVAPRIPRVAAPKNARELPIKSYNSLTVSEITGQLKGLTQTELAKVYKYERAHQNRATVLESIEGKFIELPIPTYDALTVEEITSRLDALNESELKAIRRYESETRDRTTVIEKLDSLIA